MSKKKVSEKRKKEQSQRLLYTGICIAVLILVLGLLFFMWYTQIPAQGQKLWSINNSTGKLDFITRGPIEASAQQTEKGDNYTLEKVVYKSFGDDVYALLRKPTNVTNPPVVIVLPAASVTKDADQPMAIALCNMGYATLTLDERGQGETGGTDERDWQAGYNAYVNGSSPVQYKQVYDALKGLDYVNSRGDVDGNDVAILGESIGGMWAIVAAGEEPRLKGVITISSSDFAIPNTSDDRAVTFINAVMPSKYTGSLPPRKLAMFQFDADPIVLKGDGKALFDKASEPKAWHLYNGSTHGLYDQAYAADLHDELRGMLGR
ncbi:MAG TPA: acetylxylan esterase [Methanocella sp.]|nr:acetylxylan esterase [Methanocella sp.]